MDEVPAPVDLINGIQLKLKCKGNVAAVNVSKTSGAKVPPSLFFCSFEGD